MEKKREQYLDLAKGAGIILVVMGHSTYCGNSLMKWLTSFHMPLFFVIAGMTMYLSDQKSKGWREFIRKKVRTLLIPYGIFSVCYILLTCQIQYKSVGIVTGAAITEYLIHTLTFSGLSVLWFLPALFMGQTLVYAALVKFRKWEILAGILLAGILLLVVTVPAFNKNMGIYAAQGYEQIGALRLISYDLAILPLRGLLAAVLVGFGYALGQVLEAHKHREDRQWAKKHEHQKNLINWEKGQWKDLGIAVLCLGVNVYLALQRDTTDMHYMLLGNVGVYLVTALFGSAGVIFLFRAFDHIRIPGISLLAFLGQNSLIIMLTHLDFRLLRIAMLISEQVRTFGAGILAPPLLNILFYLSFALIMLCLELVCIWIVNRYFGILIGKQVRKAP